MMMFGIDESVAKLFVKDTSRFPSDKEALRFKNFALTHAAIA
jgi:hypothetical protein